MVNVRENVIIGHFVKEKGFDGQIYDKTGQEEPHKLGAIVILDPKNPIFPFFLLFCFGFSNRFSEVLELLDPPFVLLFHL